MPEFAATLAANAALAAGAEVATQIAIATFVADYGLLLGALAFSYTQSESAKKKAKDQYNAAQTDRMANVVTSVAPRELVLGRVRKGGAVVFRGSAGVNKTVFIVHLALAGHEVDGIEQVYFNDVPVSLDASGYVLNEPYRQQRTISVFSDTSQAIIPAGSTTATLPDDPVASSVLAYITDADGINTNIPVTVAGRVVTIAAQAVDAYVNYQGLQTHLYARVWWDLGGPGSVADARTKELFPDLWTDAHKGQGTARLFCEFGYNETAFPNGIPAVTVVMRGAKVYDPRSGVTAWSDNPALLQRHVYQHPLFGKATVSSAEDARFIAAANACDTNQGWVVSGATDNQKLYRASLVAPFGTPAKSILDDLVQAMAGSWAYAGGELYVRPGIYTAPVMTLTDADLAVIQSDGTSEQQEPISIVVHRERAQKFNVVNARIWDAAQAYKEVALTPLKGTALITRDGSELAQEVSMPGVFYAPQALHVAGVMMRDARDPLTFEAWFKLKAWPIEIFDTVSVTLARYGWAAKTFMVMKREWDRARGAVKLTFKETAAAIYTPDAAFSPQGYALNTALTNPWDIKAPTLSAAGIYSGTSELLLQSDGTVLTRVRVTWPALTDASLIEAGQIDVEWVPLGGTTWQRVTVAGDRTAAYLLGAVDGNTIVVRARTRNVLATSDWSLQIAHLVIGKTERPPDVTAFTIDGDRLSWPGVVAVDLAGYQIRFAYGNNTYWASATPVHEGLITDSPYTLGTKPVGVVTLLIKAVDTSGNESVNAASIVTNLGDPDINNILLSYPEAPTFTGTITNGAVSGGVLQASGLDRFYGDDTQPFYAADGALRYPAGTYAQLQYTWSEVLLYPGTVLLEHTVVASDFGIEYQRDSQEARYGADADPFYGANADPFFGLPGAWQVWPGSIELTATETLSWRITAAAGPTQGQVSVATVILDVPDIVEEMQDVVISAGGTRLPITRSYRAIQNVLITLQTDGNGGRSVTTEDKNAALGPLITVRNAAGAAVAGLVDARIKGY